MIGLAVAHAVRAAFIFACIMAVIGIAAILLQAPVSMTPSESDGDGGRILLDAIPGR